MTEPKPEYTPTRAPIATLLDDERAERERLRATSRAYKLCAKKWRAISLQAETELAAAQDRINALRLQSGYSVVCASCGSTIDPTGTPMVCDRCYSNEYANGEQMTVDVNKWRDTAHTVETIAEKEIERLRAELARAWHEAVNVIELMEQSSDLDSERRAALIDARHALQKRQRAAAK